MGDLLASFTVLLPFLLAALVLRWLRAIRINSEKQVEQNQEIIALLKTGAGMKKTYNGIE